MQVRARILGGVILVALIDQASKWWVQHFLVKGQSVPVLPSIFQLTLTYNTGAAFSLLNQQPGLLTGLTFLIFCGLLVYVLVRKVFLPQEAGALTLVLGGALGNLVDRLMHGRVVDFLDVVAIHYPVFNVADSFIFVGVFWWMVLRLKDDAQDNVRV